MKAHIILAHPQPNSFNGHLAATSRKTLQQAGWVCTFSDLYGMNFDPREGIDAARVTGKEDDFEREADRMMEADLLLVHFPLWWFGLPAIFKGWIDRVFIHGRIYSSKMWYDNGLCKGKKLLFCVTTGADAGECSHHGWGGDTQLQLWPAHYAFRYLAFDVLQAETFHDVNEGNFQRDPTIFADYTARWVTALQSIDSRPQVVFNPETDFSNARRLLPESPSHSAFIRHED